ncbi:hypothetical protein Apmu_0067_22 [Acidiphilium multivorum AIU301]|nr:hypothetical protein Apmu_0067_22 [Acidiphilium multivorum AIU301]
MRRRHQAEQVARLLPVIVVGAMIVMCCVPLQRDMRFGMSRLIVPDAAGIGMIADDAAKIAVGTHRAIAVITAERAARRIDRNLVEVDPEPVALRIAIREQARLQHAVG